MNHESILANAAARLAASYKDEQRQKANDRLIGALRAISPDQRANGAEAAIRRLAKQEILEAKLKALSDADLQIEID